MGRNREGICALGQESNIAIRNSNKLCLVLSEIFIKRHFKSKFFHLKSKHFDLKRKKSANFKLYKPNF